MAEDAPAIDQWRRTLRFVIDGQTIEIDNVDPNRTVLQYLREDLNRTGTKEGCAEGDCGACTVVIAEPDASGKRLRARAVNSCIQFLPTLDQKELLTVESLAKSDGELHPVQQAMVDCHGSQCGFCTPGFVMSLFALFKNNPRPSRHEIDESLAGNLCRCTGYKPIVAAAESMYSCTEDPNDWRYHMPVEVAGDDESRRVSHLRALIGEGAACFSGSGRTFYAPTTVDELSELFLSYPDAILLAGGTDVGLWVTKQHRELDEIIYLGNVTDLQQIEMTESHLVIGANATLTDVIPLLTEQYPDLHELLIRFASPPIRNAGTLGGNIANGSPIGDSMPALLALDTELVLRQGQVVRTIALADFYLAYQENALQSGEFVEKILLPLSTADRQVRSYKISKRFDQDISAVCAAFSLRLSAGKVSEFRAAFGGMAAIPSRARHCENSLLGETWNEKALEAAMKSLDDDFEPLSDMRASADYRRKVCKNLLRRFYLDIENPASAGVYDYGR